MFDKNTVKLYYFNHNWHVKSIRIYMWTFVKLDNICMNLINTIDRDNNPIN